MTPSQLLIKLQVTGVRELEKIVKDLAKTNVFGGGPGNQTGVAGQQPGKGGPAEQSKLIKALGADYEKYARIVGNVQKNEAKSAEELTKQLKSQIALVEKMEEAMKNLPLDQWLEMKDKVAAAKGEVASLGEEIAKMGGGGGKWAALAGFMTKAGMVAGAAKFGYSLPSAIENSLTAITNYGVDVDVQRAQNQQLGFSAAQGNVGSLLSIAAGNTQSAQDIRERAWNQSVRGSFLNPLAWFSDTPFAKSAAVAAEAARQEHMGRLLATKTPQERNKWETLYNTAQRNVAQDFVLGGGRSMSLTGLDTGLVGEVQRMGMAMNLQALGGRALSGNPQVEALAKAVQKGFDESSVARAIALDAAIGSNVQSAFSRGFDPTVGNAIANAVMGNMGVGQWTMQGGDASAVYRWAMNGGAGDMRNVQEIALGGNLMGNLFAGGNNAYQRGVNITAAAGYGGGPGAMTLLSRFGSNPDEVAKLMQSGGKEVPAYLEGMYTGEQLMDYVRTIRRAGGTFVDDATINASKGGALYSAYRQSGDWKSALAATGVNIKNVDATKKALWEAAGLVSLADPSLTPATAHARMMYEVGLDTAAGAGFGGGGAQATGGLQGGIVANFAEFERATSSFSTSTKEFQSAVNLLLNAQRAEIAGTRGANMTGFPVEEVGVAPRPPPGARSTTGSQPAHRSGALPPARRIGPDGEPILSG